MIYIPKPLFIPTPLLHFPTHHPLLKLKLLVISKIRTRQIAIEQICEFVRMVEEISWHVRVAVDAVVDLGGAVVRVPALADPLQDLGRVGEVGFVEFAVGEGGDFVDHVFEAAQAGTAVPARVPQLGVGFADPEGFGPDGFVGAFVGGCLWVVPLFFAQGPLEAVAVVDGAQAEAAREVAVAQGFDDFGPGDFVHVGDEDHVAELDGFVGGEGREDLVHHGVAGEPLAGPCVGKGLARHVENVMDDLGVVLGESRPVFFDVERFRSVFEVDCGFQHDKIIHFRCQFAQPNFHPVEFGVDHEEIVYLSFLVPLGIWFPPTHCAIVFGLLQGQQSWSFILFRFGEMRRFPGFVGQRYGLRTRPKWSSEQKDDGDQRSKQSEFDRRSSHERAHDWEQVDGM